MGPHKSELGQTSEPPRSTGPRTTRRLFGGAAVATGVLVAAGADILPAAAAPSKEPSFDTFKDPNGEPLGQTAETANQTLEFLSAVREKGFSVDDIGYRITNAWKAIDGLWYTAYQGLVLQKNPALGIVSWNSMDELNKKGLDKQLEDVYQVPPHEDINDGSRSIEEAVDIRFRVLETPQRIAQWIQDKRKRFETGAATSKVKSFFEGAFRTVRFQRYVAQEWADGRIERVLVGDIVKHVGRTLEINGVKKTITGEKIIPDDALTNGPVILEAGGGNPDAKAPQGPVEVFLANTQVIGEPIKSADGKVTVFAEKTATAPLTPSIKPEMAQQFANVISGDVKNGNFTEAHIAVLGSVNELPANVPTINGRRTFPNNVNLGAFGGPSLTFVNIGEFTSVILNGKAVLFYIPAQGINLNDPVIKRAINESTTLNLLLLTSSGENLITGNLVGKNDHLALKTGQAVNVTT